MIWLRVVVEPLMFLPLLVVLVQCSSQEDVSGVAVGIGECADCLQYKIQPAITFKGLKIIMACKNEKEQLTPRAEGTIDSKGQFQIQLPNGLLDKKGQLKKDCFAFIKKGTTGMTCPTQGGMQAARLIYKSSENGKHTFTFQGKLSFSYLFCDSKTISIICNQPWFRFYYPMCTSSSPIPQFGFRPVMNFPMISFPPTLNFPQTPGSSFRTPEDGPSTTSPNFPVTESPPAFPVNTGPKAGQVQLSPLMVHGSVPTTRKGSSPLPTLPPPSPLAKPPHKGLLPALLSPTIRQGGDSPPTGPSPSTKLATLPSPKLLKTGVPAPVVHQEKKQR